MTSDTKSMLKSTILGLLGGSAISALYSLNSHNKERKLDSEFTENEINVPLSRKNFLKAVRASRFSKNKEPKIDDIAPVLAVNDSDISSMSPKDLASLKKSLLRKRANCDKSVKVKNIEKPTSFESKIRNIVGAGSTYMRDKKSGRFVSPDDDLSKRAGVFNDAAGTLKDSVGSIGGLVAGLAITKMISDKILINKKKKQVDKARKRYVDALTNEVNDDDLPYYSKTASDRGTVGSVLGLLGLAGLATGTAAGVVMYRIMENRRKEMEKEKDKDLAKYPLDKSINFRFPKGTTKSDASFFA